MKFRAGRAVSVNGMDGEELEMSIGKFLLRLSISLALLGCLQYKHGVTPHEIMQRMVELPLLFLLSAIVLDLSGRLLAAYRWSRLSALAGQSVSFGRMAQLYYSGLFFNLCLPTSIGGDVFKVVGLSRITGSKATALAAVFMDRNVGMAALLTVGTAAALFCPTASIQATVHSLSAEPIIVRLWPLFLLLCGAYVLANAILFSDHFCQLVTALVSRWPLGSVGAKVGRLHQAVRAYRQPWRRYLWTFALSLAYQASEILLIWILARGLGIEVSLPLFCALVPFQAAVCLLPISFNGMGVRDFVICAVLMGQLGPGIKDKALALALVYFLGVMLVSSLVGGAVYVCSGIKRPSVAEAEAAAGPAAPGLPS